MDIPVHESSLVMQQAVLLQFSLNAGNLHSWNCKRLILFPTKLMYSWGTIVIMSAEVESKYCYYSQGNQKPWTPEENIASHASFLDATFLKFYSQNSKFYSRCVSHACQFLHFFSFFTKISCNVVCLFLWVFILGNREKDIDEKNMHRPWGWHETHPGALLWCPQPEAELAEQQRQQ